MATESLSALEPIRQYVSVFQQLKVGLGRGRLSPPPPPSGAIGYSSPITFSKLLDIADWAQVVSEDVVASAADR